MGLDAVYWTENHCTYEPSERKRAVWDVFIALHFFLRQDESTAAVQGKTVKRIAHFLRMNESSVRRAITVLVNDGQVNRIVWKVKKGGERPPNDYILVGYGKFKGYPVDEEAVKLGLEEYNKARTMAESFTKPSDPTDRTVEDVTVRSVGSDGVRSHGSDNTGISTGDLSSTVVEDKPETEKSVVTLALPPITMTPTTSPSVQGKSPSHSATAADKPKKTRKKTKRKSRLTKEEAEQRDAIFFPWVEHLESKWGYELPRGRWGEERNAAWNIAKQGFSPEDVLKCYDELKDKWDQGEHMRLNAITSHIAAWKAGKGKIGRMSNGRHVSAAEMERKVVTEDTVALEAEILAKFS